MARKKTTPELPPIVYAEASVKSIGEMSLFEAHGLITSEEVDQFFSEAQLTEQAITRLRSEGFEVFDYGGPTITLAAPVETYEKVFKTSIIAKELEAIKEFGQETKATFLDSPDTPIHGLIDTSKSTLADVLEGVAINEPYYYDQNAFPPIVDYWHLDVPAYACSVPCYALVSVDSLAVLDCVSTPD